MLTKASSKDMGVMNCDSQTVGDNFVNSYTIKPWLHWCHVAAIEWRESGCHAGQQIC